MIGQLLLVKRLGNQVSGGGGRAGCRSPATEVSRWAQPQKLLNVNVLPQSRFQEADRPLKPLHFVTVLLPQPSQNTDCFGLCSSVTRWFHVGCDLDGKRFTARGDINASFIGRFEVDVFVHVPML